MFLCQRYWQFFDLWKFLHTDKIKFKLFDLEGFQRNEFEINWLQPPEPNAPWRGVFDATKDANIYCIQETYVQDASEDCLYLNVYSPETEKKSLPIIFWIYGGAFSWGGGGPGLYGAEYLMDKDVILVTINYRLGVLGR